MSAELSRRCLVVVSCALFSGIVAAAPGILHVDATATGADDGSTWANACVCKRGGLDLRSDFPGKFVTERRV